MNQPAIEIRESRRDMPPGRALDLACGAGRHVIWLRDKGWAVTAVDLAIDQIYGVTHIQADLERDGFPIEPGAWDLIVCWLYWQDNLLPSIAEGVRPNGVVALAGKTTGRFATSLANYRKAFQGWEELRAGEDEHKVYFVARRPDGTRDDSRVAVRSHKTRLPPRVRI